MLGCNKSNVELKSNDIVINRYLKNCAWKNDMHSKEWQICIDSAINKNTTIAYLYQQKAMPYLKSGDYHNGLKNLNKAVELSPENYLSYRGFMKALFIRDYLGSINDFKKAKMIVSEEYIMDHDLNFYLGLSHLMLEEFDVALKYFFLSLEKELKHGKLWVHHMLYYYLSITHFKIKEYKSALKYINECLELYETFPDAIYYKSLIYYKLNNDKESLVNIELSLKYCNLGYLNGESNEIYVNYPYQISKSQIVRLKNILNEKH